MEKTIGEDRLVPTIRKTAENDDEDEEDSDIALNTSYQPEEGGAVVVARRMRLVGSTSLRPDGSFGD